MPLFVALIAMVVLKETLSITRKMGLSLILAGVTVIIAWHKWGGAWSMSRTFGDALFLLASFLSAAFTVRMRQAKLEPLHAAALVSTGSLVIYLPVYLALHGAHFAHLTLAAFAVQAFFQGVLVTIISLVLYGRAVAILGASGGAALSALFAIPLLAEWPTDTGWVAIALISAGVYLASGGPLPQRRTLAR
jgi:drug/metabolite transporter (DMT)-like permease